MSTRRRLTPWLVGVGVGTFLAGLLVGFDQGVTSGFFLFAPMYVATFVFVWTLVPETKGRSLEEIQEGWVLGGDRMLEEPESA